MQTVPACPNLYRNSFTHHCLQEDEKLPIDDAIQVLEQCENDRARVLVHCMSSRSRLPAVVMAYLMKSSWKLAESYQWVKERRPSVDLNQAVYQQLQEYEQKILAQSITAALTCQFSRLPVHHLSASASQGLIMIHQFSVPAFNNTAGTSMFFPCPVLTILLRGLFTFGAGHSEEHRRAQMTVYSTPTQMFLLLMMIVPWAVLDWFDFLKLSFFILRVINKNHPRGLV